MDLKVFCKWIKAGSESSPNISGPGYSNGLLDTENVLFYLYSHNFIDAKC